MGKIKKRIIETAESHDVIQRYTTLNNDFTKRIKEENREIDLKNINEKRAGKSPNEKKYQKRWRVKEEEIDRLILVEVT